LVQLFGWDADNKETQQDQQSSKKSFAKCSNESKYAPHSRYNPQIKQPAYNFGYINQIGASWNGASNQQ